jgi:hypothetical protein
MSYCSDDGSCKLLLNFDQYISGYTAQRSRRQPSLRHWRLPHIGTSYLPLGLLVYVRLLTKYSLYRTTRQWKKLGFWTLSIIWCSKKTQHFQNGIYFRQVQWLRLVLSNGPSRVGAHIISTDDETRSISRNIVFLEHQTSDKVQKPSFSKYNMPSSEPFRIHKIRVRIYCKQYKSWALPL